MVVIVLSECVAVVVVDDVLNCVSRGGELQLFIINCINSICGERTLLLLRTICQRVESEMRGRSWPTLIAGLNSLFDRAFGLHGRLGQSIVRGLAEPQITMTDPLSTITVEMAGRRYKIVSAKNSMFGQTWSCRAK